MTSHRYRKAGVRGTTCATNGKWKAQKAIDDGYTAYMGTFDTVERASVAVRLFEHWVAAGHDVNAIPRQPRTRDAI